jgi:signal recognition particle GTPase
MCKKTIKEPWLSCQNKLILNDQKASTVVSQNSDIQRLISLVQRLTDRDAERRMAVHMKYHELEDEGTARAMPSAGVMGLLYHIVQIRPSLEDDYVVDQLMKLQAIKVKKTIRCY